MKNSLISIIIPAFDEKESLEELHARIQAVFDKMERVFELIFVDDGSSDGTFEFLKDLQSKNPHIIVIRHFKNRGKSLALMQGFDSAKGDIAITLDADLQDQRLRAGRDLCEGLLGGDNLHLGMVGEKRSRQGIRRDQARPHHQRQCGALPRHRTGRLPVGADDFLL